MCIRGEGLVIGCEQDCAHQQKRDDQFGDEGDIGAVNAGQSGRITDGVVCGGTSKQQRGERHTG